MEIYRARPDEIEIAERIRLHIMDSGVRVGVQEALTVRFTARSQRSDFPNAQAEELFRRVRETVGTPAGDRGYVETQAETREVTDPVDDSKILDVWHEVTYEKSTTDVDEAVDEVRWALAVEKYVTT